MSELNRLLLDVAAVEKAPRVVELSLGMAVAAENELCYIDPYCTTQVRMG